MPRIIIDTQWIDLRWVNELNSIDSLEYLIRYSFSTVDSVLISQEILDSYWVICGQKHISLSYILKQVKDPKERDKLELEVIYTPSDRALYNINWVLYNDKVTIRRKPLKDGVFFEPIRIMTPPDLEWEREIEHDAVKFKINKIR